MKTYTPYTKAKVVRIPSKQEYLVLGYSGNKAPPLEASSSQSGFMELSYNLIVQ
jgi:hypothetical protein